MTNDDFDAARVEFTNATAGMTEQEVKLEIDGIVNEVRAERMTTDDTPELAAHVIERYRLNRDHPKSRWHDERPSEDRRESWACVPLTDAVYAVDTAVNAALDPAGLRAALHQDVETALTLSSDPFSRRERVHAAIDTALDVKWWTTKLGERNGSNRGMAEFVVDTLRAVLAASPPAAEPGLDVERLSQALEWAAAKLLANGVDEPNAAVLSRVAVAEYARLSKSKISKPGLDVMKVRRHIVQASIYLANDNLVAAHEELAAALSYAAQSRPADGN